VIAIVHWWVTRGGSLHVVGIYIMGTTLIQGKSDAWNRDRGSALVALLACERDGVR
jgi:hypothetical protein